MNFCLSCGICTEWFEPSAPWCFWPFWNPAGFFFHSFQGRSAFCGVSGIFCGGGLQKGGLSPFNVRTPPCVGDPHTAGVVEPHFLLALGTVLWQGF